jgi:DNA-binding MarR family transcriptional regulator
VLLPGRCVPFLGRTVRGAVSEGAVRISLGSLRRCNAQILYITDIPRRDLKPLADELSRCWRELGTILASRRLLASLHPELAAKLTPSKLRALDFLAAHGALRVGELADRLAVDDTTATRLVDRLEELGVAERRSEPGDRRATVVGLTPAGEELVAGVASQRQRFFREVLGALEPAERAELVRLTEKAASALRARSEELAAR